MRRVPSDPRSLVLTAGILGLTWDTELGSSPHWCYKTRLDIQLFQSLKTESAAFSKFFYKILIFVHAVVSNNNNLNVLLTDKLENHKQADL